MEKLVEYSAVQAAGQGRKITGLSTENTIQTCPPDILRVHPLSPSLSSFLVIWSLFPRHFRAGDILQVMEEYNREPCPWRIIDDCGGAFSMGLIGGGVFNAISGVRNAPTGMSRRLMGGLIRVKERAPILGGQFAAWGICFS